MKQYFTFRVWLLLIALVLGFVALAPNPWATGVSIVHVDITSDAAKFGLAVDQKLLTINGADISTQDDVLAALASFTYSEQNITVETSSGTFTYTVTSDIGFTVDENLSIVTTDNIIPVGDTLVSVNGETFATEQEFTTDYNTLIPPHVISINTDSGLIAYSSREVPAITVSETKTSNLAFGLDFTGGTRVLLQPVSNDTVTDDEISTLIDVLSNRLNVYGLSDIKIRSASDWEGNKYVLVELAGVTQEEVKNLISQQGKFEAKIGDQVVFSGGEEDIPYVCRNDGSCSGVRSCDPSADGYSCSFDFSITLSQAAAERQAAITSGLDTISQSGKSYLNQSLDLYLDGELVDSLFISSDLKGQATTSISISGPGVGGTQDAAIESATENMNTLQTILITGSLPFDLEIAKLDSISPVLGESFLRNVLFVALFSILAVGAVILIRYRRLKFVLPVMFTLICELFLILGFAALVGWNLDLAAIAGILAAIGTGVDDQIVIIDEAVHGRKEDINSKERLKRAFFIIFAAYAATVAAMIPLWNAGAGLLRGFALTTIAGVTIGVFLTRPAFASVIQHLEEDEEKKK
ncbi:hypothetical protein EXS74_02700 [Candidatus Woesearchaeota archaeon]|nr:hypothetical protein [Candidatus Woesearchaeota archaeon]